MNDSLVVAGPAEEGLAAFAGEGSEVKPGSGFLANTAELVLHRVQTINLKGTKNKIAINPCGNPFNNFCELDSYLICIGWSPRSGKKIAVLL